MKKINFIKIYNRQGYMDSLKIYVSYFLILILLVVFIFNIHLNFNSSRGYIGQDIKKLEKLLLEKEQILNTLETSIDDNAYEELSTKDYELVYKDIINNLPKDTYIESINISKESVNIIGFTDKREDIFLYLDRLDKEIGYEIISLEQMENRFLFEIENKDKGDSFED